jgi:hypothetical protein
LISQNAPPRRNSPLPIAAIALAFFRFVFRGPAAILRKGAPDVVALVESAACVAPHVSFVGAGVDQLSPAMLVWHMPSCQEKLAMRAPQSDRISSHVLRAMVALAVVAAAGCSTESTSPTMPSGPSFAGTWVGAVTVAALTGNMQLKLVQSVQAPVVSTVEYSGTWTMTFPDPGNNVIGVASGRTLGATLTLTLRPSTPADACLIALSGTLDSSGTRLTGTIGSAGCNVSSTGRPVTLLKQ